MGIVLVVLMVAVTLAGLGFAIHGLWAVFVVLFVLWLVAVVSRNEQKSRP